MDMLKTRNQGNLILTKHIMGNLLFTSLMLMTPTLMKESDIDDTPSGEYDFNNTHPYERIWCWWHPPQGICFWWHPPWESDVDDTHTGESDVENNAPPLPPENLMLTMPTTTKSDIERTFSWTVSYPGYVELNQWPFSHTVVCKEPLIYRPQAHGQIKGKTCQEANVIFWSGFSVHILPRKYARWTQLAFSELCLLATSCQSTKIEPDRTKSKSINQQVKQNK